MNDYKELIEECSHWISIGDEDKCPDLTKHLKGLKDAIEQLVKERDALFEGLKYTSLSGRACAFCKHKGKYEKCNDCEPYVSKNKWEWRGVQK